MREGGSWSIIDMMGTEEKGNRERFEVRSQALKAFWPALGQ